MWICLGNREKKAGCDGKTNETTPKQTPKREERNSPTRSIALLPAETSAPSDLSCLSHIHRQGNRHCFVLLFNGTFPFTYKNALDVTPYRINQCPSLLLRKQGIRFEKISILTHSLFNWEQQGVKKLIWWYRKSWEWLFMKTTDSISGFSHFQSQDSDSILRKRAKIVL